MMPSMHSDIFSTVAKEDYLSLFQNNQKPKYQNVVNLLELKSKDVAKAAGVPQSSVRYDEKMPDELQARIREWAILLNLVAGHFHGNGDKTVLWFTVTNPMLGGVSPRDMIRFGRYKKLFSFVVNALAENKR